MIDFTKEWSLKLLKLAVVVIIIVWFLRDPESAITSIRNVIDGAVSWANKGANLIDTLTGQ